MRRRYTKRLDISVYNDYDSKMHKFINLMMNKGNKTVAYRGFLRILYRIKTEFKQSPKKNFVSLVSQLTIPVGIADMEIAKIKFKIPYLIKPSRGLTVQYLNVVKCSDSRSDNSFFERVSNEFVDFIKGVSSSYKIVSALRDNIRKNKAHGRTRV